MCYKVNRVSNYLCACSWGGRGILVGKGSKPSSWLVTSACQSKAAMSSEKRAMWTNCREEEGVVISRYTVSKSADLFINDSQPCSWFRRCWSCSALCFFYADNNIAGTVWHRCPKNGIIKLNLLRVLCDPVVRAGENEPNDVRKALQGSRSQLLHQIFHIWI